MGTVTYKLKRLAKGTQIEAPSTGQIENVEKIDLDSAARAVSVVGKEQLIAIINLDDVDVVEFKNE